MNQVANTVILPVEEYAALSAKLAKAQLEVERLARQVPPDCVVVLREPTEAMKKAAEAYRYKCLVTPGMQKTFGGYYRAMIAAGEVK